MKYKLPAFSLSIGFSIILALSASDGQAQIGTGHITQVYQQHCAICHGGDLSGGLGGSLLTPRLTAGVDAQGIADIIEGGLPESGMPAFDNTLTDEQIQALVIYIREMRHLSKDRPPSEPKDGVYDSELHAFAVETVAETDGEIWSLCFLPDGRVLFTEKEGNLRILDKAGVPGEPIAGTPEVWNFFEGGMLDVKLHPDYEENGWIYLTYSEPSPYGGDKGGPAGMTTLVRGRIEDHRWVDEEVVWRAPLELFTSGRQHFGSRILLKDGYVFFTIGDRGNRDSSQDLATAMGNVFRLHDDGRIPSDNPFVGRDEVLPEIWSYGLRNSQGLDAHPVTGQLWVSEHGPRGGDELNLIKPGCNYGWPIVTYGMNYDGSPITELTGKEGIEPPVVDWTPSIAVCGIRFYRGDAFPKWKNDLFVGSLRAQELHRVRLDGEKVLADEVILQGHGRVRDVTYGPDGALYLALNSVDDTGSRIVRLKPAKAEEPSHVLRF